MDTLIVVLLLVVLLAAFVEGVSGFGSSMVAMSILPAFLGIKTAAPLVALLGVMLDLALVAYYRHAINVRAIKRLVLGAVLGIPFGIWYLRGIDEQIVLTILGVLLVSYALYSLLKLRLPKLADPRWSWLFGIVAGLLGGAYNTPGPPVVIYGQSQGWDPAEFKGNLQSFFLVNAAIVAIGHAASGNFTPIVLQEFVIALPALAVGLSVGLMLDRKIDPLRFRQIVQVLLIVLGARMILA